MMTRTWLALFVVLFLAAPLRADRTAYTEPVRVRDGHFYVGTKRLRLWGVNLGHWHCRDYQGADVTVRRIKDMGFNCIALWVSRGAFQGRGGCATDYVESRKGDGSGADLFDYVVWRARQEGLYVVHTFFQRVFPQFITESDYDAVAGGSKADRAAWLKAVKSVDRGFGCTKFIDERVRRLTFDKARWLLNRRNPYTGLTYAEDNATAFYELADEEGFVVKTFWARGWRNTYWGPMFQRQYNGYLRKKYADDAALAAAWGTLGKGESLASATVELFAGGRVKGFSAGRWEDIMGFLYAVARRFHEDFIRMARRQAPEGVGINVQPIAVDSVIYMKPAGLYGALAGSFLCGTGVIHGGGVLKQEGDAWQWRHWAQNEPTARFFELEGLPYAPLAGGLTRPDPYRAQAPVMRAIYPSWQDHDGVFYYWWGYLQKGVPRSADDYARMPLGYGTPENRKGGYVMMGDEVGLAAIRAAGAMFLAESIKPAPKPTVFTFGREVLFGKTAYDYYDKMWPEMITTAFVHGARIRLDPKAPEKWQADGPVAKAYPPGKIKAGDQIEYNTKAGYVKVDAPGAKVFSGNWRGPVTFAGGVRLAEVTRPFVVFVLAARDGRPVGESRDMTATVVCNAAKVETHPRFKFPMPHTGVTSAGTAPAVVQRVGAQITLPRLAGRRCRKRDFAMRVLAEVDAQTGVTVKASEPVFALDFFVP